MSAVAPAAFDFTTLDYTELLRFAATTPQVREAAQGYFMDALRAGLLLHDDGDHPRMSDVGRCSLEFAAQVRGLHDLDRTADTQLLLLDQGTLSGAWNAALLKAAIYAREDESDWTVALEPPLLYAEVEGHADVFLGHIPSMTGEIIEFNSAARAGNSKAPARASCIKSRKRAATRARSSKPNGPFPRSSSARAGRTSAIINSACRTRRFG